MKEKFSIGIDMSKDEFHVCAMGGSSGDYRFIGNTKFANTYSGFDAFLAWASRLESPPLFVVESTGVYHEELVFHLHSTGNRVSVVLANRIRHYAKSLNTKTKNDKVDAKVIARYGLERNPKTWQPMIPKMKTLRDLCRERLSLTDDKSRCLCQLHAHVRSHGKVDMVVDLKRKQIKFLQESIRLIEDEIESMLEQDPQFRERVLRVATIKGVGPITVLTVLCEVNGFELFDSLRQLVSYAGLDVAERQSGKYQGKTRITKKGNARIRRCLYMPAVSATQHNPHIRALHLRVVEKNPKIKRKGTVAAMRKLLILIFVLWKKNEEYDPTHPWNNKKRISGDEENRSSFLV